MILRDYQVEAVKSFIKALTTNKTSLIIAPTGAGKTIIISAIIDALFEGKKIVVLQHRVELVEQNLDKFNRYTKSSYKTSLYNQEEKSWHGDIVFATVQTLSRENNLKTLPTTDVIDFIMIDEAHHAVSPTYKKIISKAKKLNPKLKVGGVTATPNRADRVGLISVYSNVSYYITLNKLIDEGHLVNVRCYSIDLLHLKGKVKDLVEKKLKKKSVKEKEILEEGGVLLNTKIVNDEVLRHWQEKTGGTRQTIVFCSIIAQVLDVCNAFKERGVVADYLTDKTSKTDRRRILKDFDAGKIRVLVNVGILIEGYDSQPVSCIILLRLYSFLSTAIQMIGRGMRPVDSDIYPGVSKSDCIVLDFGLTLAKHQSLIFAVDLNDGKKGKPKLKCCTACNNYIPLSCLICPLCNAVLSGKADKGKVDDGKIQLDSIELKEINILNKSPFKWTHLFGVDYIMIATGFNAFSIVTSVDGKKWFALGKLQTDKKLKVLTIANRLTAISKADDFLRMHEDGNAAYKSKRWTKEPASIKQLSLLKRMGMQIKSGLLGNTNMTKIEAAGYLNFKFNERQIKEIVGVNKEDKSGVRKT